MGPAQPPKQPAPSDKHLQHLQQLQPPNYESLPDYSSASSSSPHDLPHPYHNDGIAESDALMGGHSEKFNRSPKYKDVWATAAFIVHLLLLVLLAVAGARVDIPDAPPQPNGLDATPGDDPSQPTIPAFTSILLVILSGLLLTIGYFALMERYPRQLIHSSFIFNTATAGLLAIFYLASGAMIPALFAVLYAAIHIFMYFVYRSRMEFARVILENVTTITKAYPGTLVAGVLGVLAQTFWIVGWGVAAILASRIAQATDNDTVKVSECVPHKDPNASKVY